MSEKINHPGHYGGDTTYEAIKVIEAWGLDFCLGNAVKYICRAGKKHPDQVEDLQKAMWYLQHAIEQLTPRNEMSVTQLAEEKAYVFDRQPEAILNIPGIPPPPPPPPPLRPGFKPGGLFIQDLNRRVEALEAARAISASKLPRLIDVEQRIAALEELIKPIMKWWNGYSEVAGSK